MGEHPPCPPALCPQEGRLTAIEVLQEEASHAQESMHKSWKQVEAALLGGMDGKPGLLELQRTMAGELKGYGQATAELTRSVQDLIASQQHLTNNATAHAGNMERLQKETAEIKLNAVETQEKLAPLLATAAARTSFKALVATVGLPVLSSILTILVYVGLSSASGYVTKVLAAMKNATMGQ